MGMTISVLNAIQAFAYSWQNTKVPLYSGLIEMKQYEKLDDIFNKTLRQMLIICSSLLVMMFFGVAVLRITHFRIANSVLGERFLDYIPMILMMIPLFLNQFIGSWATYLRCHKQEPFLINSVVVGVLCCLSTFILGNKFGLYGITIGYCCIILFVSFPWSYKIFLNKKVEWHEK
jgi:O-antigen/teichoic acid export membrane protein